MEDNNLRIREIFSILTQGVEMVLHETDRKTGKSKSAGRIVWMDADIYRICVDSVRPSLADRATGKVPPGLYLRDISEVREGSFSFHFRTSLNKPKDDYTCLSIIGTEKTLSLELPSKFTRDWFLLRFRLLANDILVRQEKAARCYRIQDNYRVIDDAADVQAAKDMQSILKRGVQTQRHYRGKVERALLRYDEKEDKLLAHPYSSSLVSADTLTEIPIKDVAEVRPGTHAMGFVKSNKVQHDVECLSVVGTEGVIDVQFINQKTRDVFAQRLFDFVLYKVQLEMGVIDGLDPIGASINSSAGQNYALGQSFNGASRHNAAGAGSGLAASLGASSQSPASLDISGHSLEGGHGTAGDSSAGGGTAERSFGSGFQGLNADIGVGEGEREGESGIDMQLEVGDEGKDVDLDLDDDGEEKADVGGEEEGGMASDTDGVTAGAAAGSITGEAAGSGIIVEGNDRFPVSGEEKEDKSESGGSRSEDLGLREREDVSAAHQSLNESALSTAAVTTATDTDANAPTNS